MFDMWGTGVFSFLLPSLMEGAGGGGEGGVWTSCVTCLLLLFPVFFKLPPLPTFCSRKFSLLCPISTAICKKMLWNFTRIFSCFPQPKESCFLRSLLQVRVPFLPAPAPLSPTTLLRPVTPVHWKFRSPSSLPLSRRYYIGNYSTPTTYHLIDRRNYDTQTCIDSTNPVELHIIIWV